MNDNYSRRTFLSRSGCAAAIATGALQASELPAGQEGKKIKVAQIGVGHAHAAGEGEAVRRVARGVARRAALVMGCWWPVLL